MMLQVGSVITVVLLLLCDKVRGEQFDCVRTFTELETSLIKRDSNIESMSDAFFPPNRQVSIAANVYYFFKDGSEPDEDLDLGSYDYAFRWAASPVFELIRPELLQYLSLFVYQGQTTTTKIVLDPLCEAMPLQTKLIDEETCIGEANTTKPAQMINKLTTHLKSYVLDNRLLGVDENNRGYSSFFFNRNNTKDHCVIGQLGVFTSIRIAVATILVLLQLLTMMGGPPLLVSYYVRLCDVLKDPGQWDYMWATVLVLVLLDCVVSSLDLWVISDGLHENSRFGDIKYYYYISFLILIAHPFVNLFSTIMAALLFSKRAEIQKKYIPCLGPCRNSTLIFCIHCVVIAVIISAVQLVIAFQSYFILLAFIASPIHACSILFLYATGLFCLVVFITSFFKAFSHPKRGCLLVSIIIVVIVLLLFIFVFIQIITLVGEHRNSGGILSFVGSLGPPVLLSAIGYIGNKALKLLNNKTKEDSNKSTANKNRDDTPGDNNLVIRHQEIWYESSERVLRARQSTILVTHPP